MKNNDKIIIKFEYKGRFVAKETTIIDIKADIKTYLSDALDSFKRDEDSNNL